MTSKAEIMADVVLRLARDEVKAAVKEGALDPGKLVNQDFMYGVMVGISLTTIRMYECQEREREAVLEALIEAMKK